MNKRLLMLGMVVLIFVLAVSFVTAQDEEAPTLSPDSPAGQLQAQAEALAHNLLNAINTSELVQDVRAMTMRLQLSALLNQEQQGPLASLSALTQVADLLSTLPLPTRPEAPAFSSDWVTNLNNALSQFDPREVFSAARPVIEGWERRLDEFFRSGGFDFPALVPAIP